VAAQKMPAAEVEVTDDLAGRTGRGRGMERWAAEGCTSRSCICCTPSTLPVASAWAATSSHSSWPT